MVSTTSDPQAAPDGLESVRELLNTWLIPNDTGVPTDRFDTYRRRRRLRPSNAATLRELRDDLRTVVEGSTGGDEVLTGWIDRLGVTPVVDHARLRFRHEAKPAGDALVLVLDAITAGSWPRLKACPNCRWVFYDHSRSATKRWCLMNAAGPDGRGCGNITKARRHRARQRAAS